MRRGHGGAYGWRRRPCQVQKKTPPPFPSHTPCMRSGKAPTTAHLKRALCAAAASRPRARRAPAPRRARIRWARERARCGAPPKPSAKSCRTFQSSQSLLEWEGKGRWVRAQEKEAPACARATPRTLYQKRNAAPPPPQQQHGHPNRNAHGAADLVARAALDKGVEKVQRARHAQNQRDAREEEQVADAATGGRAGSTCAHACVCARACVWGGWGEVRCAEAA